MSTNDTNLAERLSNLSATGTTKNYKPQTCALCQQRKTKCDKRSPCSNCLKARVECIPASLRTRPRKKRFPEAELLAQLRRYETALKSYGANLEDLRGDQISVETRPGQDLQKHGEDIIADTRMTPKTDGWTDASDEFRATEEVLQGSSGEEAVEGPLTSSFNDMYRSRGAGNWLFPPGNTEMAIEHPQPVHIFRLWQTFLDNVYPLVKVFHAPTVQQQILEAMADLENISESLEALLFGIYCCAVMTLNDAECKSMFGEEQVPLLTRYQSAAQQALLNAQYLSATNVTVLQAFALYLTTLQFKIDPRSHFCLTGISVRIAQRMGLHRDGSSQRLPPFETEVRRRLWWQVVLFDSRAAEFSGAGTSNVTHRWSTRLPLNVNDSDLYPDMREPPIEHSGATEMFFCLTKCEIAEFLRKTRSMPGFDCNWYELSTPVISTSAKDQAINDLEALLQRKYLLFCEPEIPIQALTRAMTIAALSKMRFIVHHPRLLPDGSASMPSSEKDLILNSATLQLSCYIEAYENRATQHFRWHINTNAPLEAYIYILSDLRERPTSALANQAWRQIQVYVDYREEQMTRVDKYNSTRFATSPVYYATSNLMVKAWEAREAALLDPNMVTPRIISVRRRDLEQKRNRTGDPKQDANIKSDVFEFETPISLSSEADTPGQFYTDNPMDWSLWSDFMNGNDIPEASYTFN